MNLLGAEYVSGAVAKLKNAVADSLGSSASGGVGGVGGGGEGEGGAGVLGRVVGMMGWGRPEEPGREDVERESVERNVAVGKGGREGLYAMIVSFSFFVFFYIFYLSWTGTMWSVNVLRVANCMAGSLRFCGGSACLNDCSCAVLTFSAYL